METITVRPSRIRKMLDPLLFGRPITVDENLPFEKRIAVGGYKSRHEYFTEENFSVKSKEKREPKRTAYAFYLRRTKATPSREEVEAYLRAIYFRPADTEELLAFGQQYPEFQKKHPVIALASIAKIGPTLYAPVLDVDCEWREKPCRSVAIEWCHFGLRHGMYVLAFKS